MSSCNIIRRCFVATSNASTCIGSRRFLHNHFNSLGKRITTSTTTSSFVKKQDIIPKKFGKTSSIRLFFTGRPTSTALCITTNTPIKPSTTSWQWLGNNDKEWWKRIATIIRFIRTPTLVLSVYGLGYQQGIIDDIRDPEATRLSTLDQILASNGVESRKKGVYYVHEKLDDEVATTNAVITRNIPYHTHDIKNNIDVKRIAKVGRNILRVAREYVDENLEKRIEILRKNKMINSSNHLTSEQIIDKMKNDDKELEKWVKARAQLNGNWTFMYLDTNEANAFVSELLPRSIFVTTTMFNNVIAGDNDQLALILGHEVSHMIHGHVSEENGITKLLVTIEIVLLSVDPTEGLLSLGIMGLLSTLKNSFVAKVSRDHEREADETGMILAAMACYNTRKGAELFYKLHKSFDTNDALSVQWNDTHPPSIQRYYDLLRHSKKLNSQVYPNRCTEVKKRMKLFGVPLY